MKQNSSNSQLYGVLAIAATALLWSTSGMLIKLLPWSPLTIAGGRSIIASIVILLYTRNLKIKFTFYKVAAAVANSATMLLFIAANKYTSAANAILLQYVCPVITALLAVWLLKEKTRLEHWIAVFFVIAGMIIIFFDRLGGGHFLGNLLAIASAFTFSFVFIFMRKQKESEPLEALLLSHWMTAAIGLGASFFMPLPVFTIKTIGAISVMGIFQIGFSSILFSYGIKRISAINANLIAMIEPVMNPVWVLLVIGEIPTINTIIGGAIIVVAVTAASVVSAKRDNLSLLATKKQL